MKGAVWKDSLLSFERKFVFKEKRSAMLQDVLSHA
jgi:hypothetical protein